MEVEFNYKIKLICSRRSRTSLKVTGDLQWKRNSLMVPRLSVPEPKPTMVSIKYNEMNQMKTRRHSVNLKSVPAT